MGEEDESGSSSGFTYVARKGKPNRRRRGVQKEEAGDGEEARRMRLARRREIVATKKAFLCAGEIGKQIDTLFGQAFSGHSELLPSSILVLGLGSVKESRAAQLQLAFMLLVRDWLQGNIHAGEGGDGKGDGDRVGRVVEVRAYDPIFDQEDRQLLSTLSINSLDENLQGRYPLGEPVFVYMPHCTKTLYENILRSNWNAKGLDRLWLCCNELERYVGGKSSAAMTTTPCISRIVPRLTVNHLPLLPSPNHDALNDLAIQRYHHALDSVDALACQLDQMALGEDPFWSLPPADAIGNDDAELI